MRLHQALDDRQSEAQPPVGPIDLLTILREEIDDQWQGLGRVGRVADRLRAVSPTDRTRDPTFRFQGAPPA